MTKQAKRQTRGRMMLDPMTTKQATRALRSRGWIVASSRSGRVAAYNARESVVLDQTSQGWQIIGGGPRLSK